MEEHRSSYRRNQLSSCENETLTKFRLERDSNQGPCYYYYAVTVVTLLLLILRGYRI